MRACLAAGARRIYAGARDLKSLAGLVRENAGRVTALALDITDPESLARAAADAPRRECAHQQRRGAYLAKRKISVHAALPGAIDTDMVRAMDMPKTSPEVVAAGIVEGVELGLDEITPDPMSRELFLLWRSDPKQLELRLASLSG